jgi:predicted DNA-binding ArsR family transcriptional regulator
MSPNTMTGSKEHSGAGFVQWAIFLVISLAVGYISHVELIPRATSSFVVSQFTPSGDELGKIGFAKFNDLVWASTSKEKESGITESTQVSKDLVNGEYIMDFSWTERELDKHGYSKGATEWYVKAPAMGEKPIFLEPNVGFWILALVIGLFVALLLTIVMPSSLGLMSALFEKEIEHVKVKIRLQTGFSDKIVEMLTMPDNKLKDAEREDVERLFRTIWERTTTDTELATKKYIDFDDIFDDETDLVLFRNEAIYNRIKEFFSDFVVTEIVDTKNGLEWRSNHFKMGKGFKLYMAHHFTEQFSNNVTGLAYGGAAVLIVGVGIRGLKFIPADRPSVILFVIFLEFTMLVLLAVTMFYTENEERMDKMLKKMEDANRSQLETLRGQQEDIHQLSTALVGQTSEIIKTRVENAISEYMTSGDQVQRQIAGAIADKIIFDIKGTNK